MRKYISAMNTLSESEEALNSLRRSYAKSRSQATGQKIDQAEKLLESQRDKVKQLRNDVYKSLARK